MKCLNDEQLKRLTQSSADPAIRLQELLHLEECAGCKVRLTESAAFAAAANGIAESILDVADCPEYETLSEYLDGSIHIATAQKLVAHLNSCPYCFADIERMQSIRAAAVLRGEIVVEARDKTAAKPPFPAWGWVFGTSMSAVVVAAVMVVMPMLQRVNIPVPIASNPVKHHSEVAVSPTKSSEQAPIPKKIIAADTTKHIINLHVKHDVRVAAKPDVLLRDGGLQIARKDGKLVVKIDGRGGSVEKLIASYIDQKLRTGRVKAAEPVQLAMVPKVLRGSQEIYSSSPIAPKPKSPIGKVILSAQPLLEWNAVDMAQDYQVTVTDVDGRVVYEAVTLKTRVKIDMPLDRGKIYAWRVASRFSDEGEWEISPAVAFKVISSNNLKLIDTARKQLAGSKLALGAVYESLQLQDEAQREYKSLAPRARGVDLLRSLNGK